jgi:gas vesicle protein
MRQLQKETVFLKLLARVTRITFSKVILKKTMGSTPHRVKIGKDVLQMNNFVKGVLLGVGVGLLVAPMRGEEMRRMISDRASEMRGYLPENEQLDVYKQQVTDRVSQTASNLKDYAQQAAFTVKSSASNLSTIGQNAASEVKSTSKDVANTTKDTVNSNKVN